MTLTKSDPLDTVFLALADKTRRSLVHTLVQGEITMTDLALPYEMSLAAISKHVKILEKANLIRRRIVGRIHYISLVPEQLSGALDWITIYRYFWKDRFDK